MAKWSTKNLFKDESGDRYYFAMIPTMLWPDIKRLKIPVPEIIQNHVKELGIKLSVHDRWLYATIKRICGEKGGQCFLNTTSLARLAGMSVGKVSEAKLNLEKAGLIIIISKKRSSQGRPIDHITVRDVWERNIATIKARQKSHEDEDDSSPTDGLNSRMDGLSSPSETEEEPIEEKPIEEKPTSPNGDEIPKPDLPLSEFDEDGTPIDTPQSKKRYVPDCEYEDEQGNIEVIEDDSWKKPQKQIDSQALEACGRESFHTKKEYSKLRKIEAMLESGKLSEEFWRNRVVAAEKHHWSFPDLLRYTLSVDLQRKWKRRQGEAQQ